MFKFIKEILGLNKAIDEKKKELQKLNETISVLLSSKEEQEIEYENKKNEMVKNLDNNVNKELNELTAKKEIELKNMDKQCKELCIKLENKEKLDNEIMEKELSYSKLCSNVEKELKKVNKLKEDAKKIKYVIEKYSNMNILNIETIDLSKEEVLAEPTVILKLKNMDVKELRSAFKANQKQIKETLKSYEDRYNTKANKAIYKLMVLALESELQNVLYNLKFEKLEKSVQDVKEITEKYTSIAATGNQSIVSTIMKFIGEIEFLYIKAVEIEYEYYIRKEQIKEEQARLREQMKQEAEERKILEEQRKQVEKEEDKYLKEIKKVEELLSSSEDDNKIKQLNEKIAELKSQLEQVEEKKEEIVKRQNGKAGYVYVISNLGSFGENVFKIGMTRRLDPMDRIKELSDASVPFTFDVHSFIFSDDAVALEKSLHDILSNKRVNKINMRKEFFNVSIDELEETVQNIDNTAEFNKTMVAEQYRQSLALDILETDEDSILEAAATI